MNIRGQRAGTVRASAIAIVGSALVLGLGMRSLQADDEVSIEVTGASAGAPVSITINGAAGGEVRADAAGEASSMLGLVNLGTVEVVVWVKTCRDDRVVLALLTEGQAGVREEAGCERRRAGTFWADQARTVTVDADAATIVVDDGSGIGSGTIVAIGGGAAAAGVGIALASQSDDETVMDIPESMVVSTPTIEISSFYGTYAGLLEITAVTGATEGACGSPAAASLTLTLSGNPNGSGFVLDKGGIMFQGVIRPDGTFTVQYDGPITGFANLPADTTIRWRVGGGINGTQLAGAGELTVTDGPCNGVVMRTVTTGTKMSM